MTLWIHLETDMVYYDGAKMGLTEGWNETFASSSMKSKRVEAVSEFILRFCNTNTVKLS